MTAGDLPPEERKWAKTLLLDTVGVMLVSTDDVESSSIARDLAKSVYGHGECAVLNRGTARRS